MQQNVAIQFDNLSKTFGRGAKRVQAVKNLNLNIESGQVYGFLGPNGAGKTTTIRLIMDLIRPTQGDVYVYGQHVRRQHTVLRNVGAIVEHATFYPFLTGQRNLELLTDTGRHDPERIPALLDQVGLSEMAKKRVANYSTGMRQRLGLAAALLGDPKLLILDEPTAGLDPAGMHEVRTYLRELVDNDDKTVFVSSHLLSEVEQFCDRVAIIHEGEIVREGRVTDLLSAHTRIRLLVAPLQGAVEALDEHWEVRTEELMRRDPDEETHWVSVGASQEEVPHIVRCLVAEGINVFQVTTHRQSLEAYFLEATQEMTNRD